MRALLINPELKTVTEIEVSGDDTNIEEIQKILHCNVFTTGAHLRGSIATGFDAVYVSDDELQEDERFWFQVDAERHPPSSHPIAGLGLAMGADKRGATCNVGISAAELLARLTFTQRKFRGFETITGDAARARGADIIVDMNAPIIDGTDEGV